MDMAAPSDTDIERPELEPAERPEPRPGGADFADGYVDPGQPDAGQADQAAEPREPFTAQEVAQGVAIGTSLGLPMDAMQEYQELVVQRTAGPLAILDVGDVLAHYGITKGSGVDALPYWARALGACVAIGFGVASSRRQVLGGAGQAEGVDYANQAPADHAPTDWRSMDGEPMVGND